MKQYLTKRNIIIAAIGLLMLCCVCGAIGNIVNPKPVVPLTPVLSKSTLPTPTIPTQVINTPTLLQPSNTPTTIPTDIPTVQPTEDTYSIDTYVKALHQASLNVTEQVYYLVNNQDDINNESVTELGNRIGVLKGVYTLFGKDYPDEVTKYSVCNEATDNIANGIQQSDQELFAQGIGKLTKCNNVTNGGG